MISTVALIIALLSLLSNFEKFSKFIDVWCGILRGKHNAEENCKYLQYAKGFVDSEKLDIYNKHYELAHNSDLEIPSYHIFVFSILKFFERVQGTYDNFTIRK